LRQWPALSTSATNASVVRIEAVEPGNNECHCSQGHGDERCDDGCRCACGVVSGLMPDREPTRRSGHLMQRRQDDEHDRKYKCATHRPP
jgi:hypothetical protein